jgi:hypothetical protein
MAWGLQGATGKRTPAIAWANKTEIKQRLMLLRAGHYTRARAYDLFAHNPIPGLGPSYFTKLIYFFQPDTGAYIMDQWTAKSINLITGHHVVRIYGASPASANSCENYESFCQVIDYLAMLEGCTGDELEQRLFSQNAQYGRQRGAWREHVLTEWETEKPALRYDHKTMTDWVRSL